MSERERIYRAYLQTLREQLWHDPDRDPYLCEVIPENTTVRSMDRVDKDKAYCACLSVSYDPVVDGGIVRERWSCTECGREFTRKRDQHCPRCKSEEWFPGASCWNCGWEAGRDVANGKPLLDEEEDEGVP